MSESWSAVLFDAVYTQAEDRGATPIVAGTVLNRDGLRQEAIIQREFQPPTVTVATIGRAGTETTVQRVVLDGADPDHFYGATTDEIDEIEDPAARLQQVLGSVELRALSGGPDTSDNFRQLIWHLETFVPEQA